MKKLMVLLFILLSFAESVFAVNYPRELADEIKKDLSTYLDRIEKKRKFMEEFNSALLTKEKLAEFQSMYELIVDADKHLRVLLKKEGGGLIEDSDPDLQAVLVNIEKIKLVPLFEGTPMNLSSSTLKILFPKGQTVHFTRSTGDLTTAEIIETNFDNSEEWAKLQYFVNGQPYHKRQPFKNLSIVHVRKEDSFKHNSASVLNGGLGLEIKDPCPEK